MGAHIGFDDELWRSARPARELLDGVDRPNLEVAQDDAEFVSKKGVATAGSPGVCAAEPGPLVRLIRPIRFTRRHLRVISRCSLRHTSILFHVLDL
ncbi:MAG: hypothetical protein QGG09_14790, partial [Pirellulaceae bacterium]|nr:hypothetical protein [Pirellulaceae bacterium]